MIEKFKDKLKEGNVELAFAESGSIALIERKFDPDTGVPVMRPTQETNSQHVAALLEDAKKQMAPFLQRITDLEDIAAAVAAKEEERAKLVEKKAKEKAK